MGFSIRRLQVVVLLDEGVELSDFLGDRVELLLGLGELEQRLGVDPADGIGGGARAWAVRVEGGSQGSEIGRSGINTQ